VFDCAWNESVASQVLFGCGDGKVVLWDYKKNEVQRQATEHTQEIYSVDWNLVNKENYLTGSWDNTVKVWHPSQPHSLRTFREHTSCVYAVAWHPKQADVFASVSADCCLKVWDMNDTKSIQTIKAHDYEVLTCDWSRYNDFHVFTGSVDTTIRGFDIRKPSQPFVTMTGHDFAVRKVKCSPHSPRVVASASYDMSVCVWDVDAKASDNNHLLGRYEHHTEFVVGLDFNMFVENRLAACSWDEHVSVWSITAPSSV
jgi:peroxin-7